MSKQVRLDKFLADAGAGTRSQVKGFLKKGLVTVNGEPARKPEQKISPETDLIVFQGTVLSYTEFYYYMLNKPSGYVSATDDNTAPTVLSLLKGAPGKDLFPVGRLDKDTEGLLIITDDGDYAHRVLSPKKNVDKLYEAVIDGPVGDAEVEAFRLGIVFEDGTVCRPAGLRVLRDGDTPLVQVRICEGKFHQVKKMFRAVGRTVQALRRVQIGALKLDPTLAPGAYREMTSQEITFVFEAQKDTPNIVQN